MPEEGRGARRRGVAAASPAAAMSEDEKAVLAFGAAVGQQVAQQVKPLEA